MSKRYGRNQKRKHLEEIATLKAALSSARNAATVALMEADRARFARQSAEAAAFQRFLNSSGLLCHILEKMAVEMGRAAGERYREEFRLAQSAVKPEISWRGDPTRDFGIVSLRLPMLHLQYPVWNSDMDGLRSPWEERG
jgi:hypothetical protein